MKKESSFTAARATAMSLYQSPAIQVVELGKNDMLSTSMNTSESLDNETYLIGGDLDDNF